MTRIASTAAVFLLGLVMASHFGLHKQADAQTTNTSIRRLVLVVGANDGGADRTPLRYAGTDAARVAKLTRELGGVAASDVMVVDDSSLPSLEAALTTLGERLSQAKAKGVRVEVLFYYSGHSDETGLLLGGARYSYKELRKKIESLPAEVKIAILDSCASGAFTRTKGGSRRPAFLVDESSQVAGYAFLASSSATELAQESDRIASSFFTHFFVSGLRGGADGNRDGRVTLSEAYQYAFDETVSRTESTQGGTQHPAYDMHLAGTGDVVMTDLRSTTATLVVEKQIAGRLFIRDQRGDLVVELSKEQRHPMTLGLAPGTYSVVLKQGDRLSKATIVLKRGQASLLRASVFSNFKADPTVARGGSIVLSDAQGPKDEYQTVYFGASLLPSIGSSGQRTRRNISLNLLGGAVAEIHGLEVGAGINFVSSRVEGAQFAGVANIVGGDMRGLQAAGVLNTSNGHVVGAQLASVANINRGDLKGLQATAVTNINHGNLEGIQAAAVANLNTGDLDGAQLSSVANLNQGKMRGLQATTVYNHADHIEGLQVSSVANSAGSVEGAQISLLNISSGKVKGFQLGLVNYAEESDVSIGIINIVKNGYRSLDAWASDTAPFQLGLKLGSRKVYSLLALSQETSGVPMAGFGLGYHHDVSDYYIDADLVTYARIENKEEMQPDTNDMLAKLRFTLGWRLTQDIAIIGGVAFNSSFSFEGEGEEESVIHGRVRTRDNYTLRYGPGLFAGASWLLGR